MELSDSESEVEYIEPDSASLQIKTTSLWDFLEDDASVVDSAVMPTSECEWT